MADAAHAHRAILHRGVLQKRIAYLAIVVFNALEHALHLSELRVIDIADDTANLHDREDDAPARSLFEDVEHALAQAPAVHEQALEAECVGGKSHPQHVGVNTRELMPDNAQIFCSLGYLHAHKPLYRFGITHGVPECADAAYTLRHVDKLVVVACLDKLLKASMDKPDLGYCLDNSFVLDHEIEMQRFGQHRMLGAERDDGRLSHATHLPPLPPRRPRRPPLQRLSSSQPRGRPSPRARPSPWRLSQDRGPRPSRRRQPASLPPPF